MRYLQCDRAGVQRGGSVWKFDRHLSPLLVTTFCGPQGDRGLERRIPVPKASGLRDAKLLWLWAIPRERFRSSVWFSSLLSVIVTPGLLQCPSRVFTKMSYASYSKLMISPSHWAIPRAVSWASGLVSS